MVSVIRRTPVIQEALSKLSQREITFFENYVMGTKEPHVKLSRMKFSKEDDAKLRNYVGMYGFNWTKISELLGNFNKKQCRERWLHYLNPEINHYPFSAEEDARLQNIVGEIGTKWTEVAKLFPGRTDTHCKNRWIVLKRRMALGQKRFTTEEFFSEFIEDQ